MTASIPSGHARGILSNVVADAWRAYMKILPRWTMGSDVRTECSISKVWVLNGFISIKNHPKGEGGESCRGEVYHVRLELFVLLLIFVCWS